MANRKNDPIDILEDASHGYQVPIPNIVIESRENTFEGAIHNNTSTILVRKDYEYTRFERSLKYEDRIFDFPVTIISVTDDDINTIFTEMREVFNRYTENSGNFDALTTGNSYDWARVEQGRQERRKNKFVMQVNIQLVEELVENEQ